MYLRVEDLDLTLDSVQLKIRIIPFLLQPLHKKQKTLKQIVLFFLRKKEKCYGERLSKTLRTASFAAENPLVILFVIPFNNAVLFFTKMKNKKKI